MARLLSTTSPALNIQLDCGQSVSVEAFMYGLTYGGLIEGAPNESLNIMIMERALICHEALWGERQTYMIPPAMDVSDPARPTLPGVNLHVWPDLRRVYKAHARWFPASGHLVCG